jgi:hypothetical protein
MFNFPTNLHRGWDNIKCNTVSEYAAIGGNIEVLAWLLEKKCKFTYLTTASAALNGQMETLQWLVQHEAPITSMYFSS